MKITGILAIKNGIVGGFPFLEGILSILPIVDEFLVVDGGSSDETRQVLKQLKRAFPEKIRLFQDTWVSSPTWDSMDASLNGLVSQAEGDWIFSIQGDEVWHELDIRIMREFIESADRAGYNGIRAGCIEARWCGLNTTYLRGSVYKTIRIFKKQPNLRLFRAGDDVFVEPNRVQREGFTSSNLPPELDAEFGFYHFHRVFPENSHNADKMIQEELATGAMDRKIFYQEDNSVGDVCSDLPEIMKGLAYKSRYKVRDELFDVNWLNKTTGLRYGKLSNVGGGSEMELLKNFDLDNFGRRIWLNQKAKNEWEPVLSDAFCLLQDMEVESVVRGQRPCSWQTVEEKYHSKFRDEWEKKGLVSAIVRRVGRVQGFTNKHYPVREGEPAMVCCILSKNMDDLEAFRQAVEKEDDYTMGALLGYPECCCRFFVDVWLKGYQDPIWQAALNSSNIDKNSHYIKIKSYGLFNPVLRFLSIRIAFHIPCSFNCQGTAKITKERLELAKEINPVLVDKLVKLLRMPISWDCYHGIALVRTPIVYAVVPSCGSVERFVVEFEGDYIPPEAERGLVYPNNLIKE